MEREKIALFGVVLGVGLALFLNQDDSSVYEGTYALHLRDSSSVMDVATISPEDTYVPTNSSKNSYIPTTQGTQVLPLDQFQDSNTYDRRYIYDYPTGSYYNGSSYYYTPYPYYYYHPYRNEYGRRMYNYGRNVTRPPLRAQYQSYVRNDGRRGRENVRSGRGSSEGGHQAHDGGDRGHGGDGHGHSK